MAKMINFRQIQICNNSYVEDPPTERLALKTELSVTPAETTKYD